MGYSYDPFWKVGCNDAQGIPEGATFYIEGYRRRIRFEVGRGAVSSSIRVTETQLKRKVGEPVFYYRVGKGVRHEMPDLAVVRFKIDPLVACMLMLTGPFAVLEFYRRKSTKKVKEVVVSTTGPGDEGVFVPIQFHKGYKHISARVWCLDDSRSDFIEREVKKGKTWKVEEPANPFDFTTED